VIVAGIDAGHHGRVLRNLLRTASAIVLAATATGVSLAVTAQPAQAVAGIVYVNAISAHDSTTPKTVTAICPGGTAAIGGAARITGATGDVTIRAMRPARLAPFGIYYYGATAEEDPDGFAGSWSLEITGVCVPTPGGLEYVSASGTDPALLWVTSSCGTKRVIGSGYTVTATAAVKASGVQIDSNRAYLSVEPSRVAGAVTPFTGTITAVCANAAYPDQEMVSVDTAQDSFDGKTAAARCPSGKQIIGVGAGLIRFRNHTVIDDFWLTSSTNTATVTGYEDQAGNPDIWAATAYALCAA